MDMFIRSTEIFTNSTVRSKFLSLISDIRKYSKTYTITNKYSTRIHIQRKLPKMKTIDHLIDTFKDSIIYYLNLGGFKYIDKLDEATNIYVTDNNKLLVLRRDLVNKDFIVYNIDYDCGKLYELLA
jgi:hypothetical protein